MVLFHLFFFFCTRPFDQNIWPSFIYSFFLHKTIRPKIRVLIDLFLSFTHDHSTKMYGPLSFILSFVHDHSTKHLQPHWFILFICTRPFYQNVWSSFIYFFFSGRPFNQKLGTSLIYFFYLHRAIRPKYKVLFHLFFFWHTTIQPKIRVLIDLFLLFAHDHVTKMCGSLSYILLLCTTIRRKIRVLVNLFLLFLHDHSAKITGCSCSLVYSFLSCTNISYAIFMAVLALYFVHYIHVSTALIFLMLYSWPYEVLAAKNRNNQTARTKFIPVTKWGWADAWQPKEKVK